MAEGNRKDPRARVLNMTVRYKSATVDEFIENHSHDISRGGIFIKTRSPFPAGTLLKFEVRIAEDQKLMQGVGRVVWRREPERAEDGFPAGMGIKFIKTGEGAAELISQIVAARQGEESSFDAGARENASEIGSGRRSAAPPPAPEAAEAAAPAPISDAPALQVESAPPSVPAEGETRVSSPPKKRAPQQETRKVVLQPAAFDAPPSDKTPVSSPAQIAATRAVLEERAPSRAEAKGRGSLADEITAPRARLANAQNAPTKPEQSSPRLYGLVAVLGLLGLTVVFINRQRSSAPAEPPHTPSPAAIASEPAHTAAPAPPAPPAAAIPPAAAEPSTEGTPTEKAAGTDEPSAGAGEGEGEPVAVVPNVAVPNVAVPNVAVPGAKAPAATTPAAAAAATPHAVTPAPTGATGTAAAGESAAQTKAAPAVVAKPGAAATSAAPKPPAAAPPPAAKPPAAKPPAPPVAAKPPAPAPKPPAAAAKPPAAKPPSAPADQNTAQGSAGAAAKASPAEGETGGSRGADRPQGSDGQPTQPTAKKAAPAAPAPSDAPAPAPKPANDNPY